jgi:translocator protein
MGYSSYLAYKTLATSAHGSFTLYTIQLLLNFAFIPLYSALGERWLGLLDMLLLDGCVVWLIFEWGDLTPKEGLEREAWGLVPYAAWLVFATYLAVAYGVLNGWRNVGRERWRAGKNGVKEKIS